MHHCYIHTRALGEKIQFPWTIIFSELDVDTRADIYQTRHAVLNNQYSYY